MIAHESVPPAKPSHLAVLVSPFAERSPSLLGGTMKKAVRKASLALALICCTAGVTFAGIEVLAQTQVMGIEVLQNGPMVVHTHSVNFPEGATMNAYRDGQHLDSRVIGSDGFATVVFMDDHPHNLLVMQTAEGIEVLSGPPRGIEVLSGGWIEDHLEIE